MASSNTAKPRRAFRSEESHREERKTRAMLSSFLERKGFRDIVDARKAHGSTESQTISAVTPSGDHVTMNVRICWRRDGRRANRARNQVISAAQLLARIDGGDWEGSINAKLLRQQDAGMTHLLLVQKEAEAIVSASLIPISGVLPIWRAQRDVSAELIKRGQLGRRKKNHAMNGVSPTLYLHDEAAPTVAAQLWNYRGVVDVAALPEVWVAQESMIDDTYDDLPISLIDGLGSDGGAAFPGRERSYIKRDPRVRAVVLQRASGKCERPTCRQGRNFTGFLDVHHILGVGTSDRVYNCVAVCPNCHREAHFAPGRDEINALLLRIAAKAPAQSRNKKKGRDLGRISRLLPAKKR